MKSILYKLLIMLLGGVLLGYNAGKLEDVIPVMLFIVGLAMIETSIFGISKQIGKMKTHLDGGE